MILVCGLPRSGTSWLGKIFDSHPATLYRHEPDKSLQLAGAPILLSVDQLPEQRGAIERFVDEVLANRSPAVTGKRPYFPKSYRSRPREIARRAAGLLARTLPQPLCERVRVPDLIDPDHPGPRLVWKSINSIGRLGVLARILPQSRSVVIVRHPCGQIASILRGHAAGKFKNPLPSEQYRVLELLVNSEQGRAHGLTLAGLRELQPVQRMAWRWVLFMEKVLADIAGLTGCRIVRYEDLCEEPLERVRELFAFTGVSWHSQTEIFLRESTNGENGNYFSVRKDPRHSAGKWQQELAEKDVLHILDILRRSQVRSLYLENKETDRRDVAG